MKKTIVYMLIGIFFGIVLYKSEAASWFRIYEMFRFQSFHMYGIIGSALVLGIVGIQIIKRKNIKSINGNPIKIENKDFSYYRYIFGGILFGLGWALVGSCPGPIFALLGAGYWPILIVLVSSLIGTFLYGVIKDFLPH